MLWLVLTTLDGLLFSGYDNRILSSIEEAFEILETVRLVDENSKIAEVRIIG